MKRLLAFVMVFSVFATQYACACGGSGSGIASRCSNGGVKFASSGSSFIPIASGVSSQQAKFAMTRQAVAAKAAAYNARMYPIRLANANRIRQQRIAAREARKEIRIAKLEAKREQEQVFLATARTWTDTTGQYKVVAILADVNAWGVKLQKQDGSTVNVPMQRLSSPDQSIAAAAIARGIDSGVRLAVN